MDKKKTNTKLKRRPVKLAYVQMMKIFPCSVGGDSIDCTAVSTPLFSHENIASIYKHKWCDPLISIDASWAI